MFGKKEETPVSYRGNVCPPPWPQATEAELAESAEEFADIMDTVFDLLEQASKLIAKPVEDENNRGDLSGWFPRFPICGQQVEKELFQAKASVIEANKMVAVQGYAAQRRLRKGN